MLLSMTGYSTETVTLKMKSGKKVSLSIEIKSLNSRFLELTTKFPSSLSFLETDVYLLLKKKLIRGRTFCAINIDSGESLESIVPSISNAEAYIDAAKKIKQKFKVKGDLEISELVALPNIFESSKCSLGEADKSSVMRAIEKIAEGVNSSRKVEGANLKKDIEHRFVLCSKALGKIKILYEKLMKDHKKLIAHTSKLAEKDNEIAASKLEDLYAMLNKIDINEEITRFKSHISTVEIFLKDKILEKGKRLDFMLQELVRETNTIAAKCSNADISRLAVDIKVELEKVREQTQNVL